MIDGAIAIGVQFLALIVLRFGDIGFDFPGKYGLDYGHALLITGAYLVALVYGVIRWSLLKRWALVALQLVLAIMFGAMFVV